MKFFFDECLNPDLVMVAHEANVEATCSRNLGMLGWKDWDLAKFVTEYDWVLVTQNCKDFRGKKSDPHGKPGHLTQDLHPGLICLHCSGDGSGMTPEVQKQLFEMALDEIRQQGITDLMNQVLELEFDELTQCVRVNRYEAPEHSPPG